MAKESSEKRPLIVDGQTDIRLTCRVLPSEQGKAKMVLYYGDTNLHDCGAQIVVRPKAGAENVTFSVADFERDGKKFRVNCFAIDGQGTLLPWERIGDSCATRTMPATRESLRMPFVVVAVREDGQETFVDDYPIADVDNMGRG